MACALTQGYTLDCKDSLGGITEVYFMSAQDVASYTVSGGVMTALTKDSGKRFYKYELVKATSGVVENINASVENGTIFYQQELTIVLNKLQANTRNEILLLAKNLLVAVAKDNNGKYWLMGYSRGAVVSAGTSVTGTAVGDLNGYTLTLTAQEPAMAYEVQATPASTFAGCTFTAAP